LGSATPLKAATDFVRRGGLAGYGTPTTAWHIVITHDGAEARSNRVNLHVWRRPNHRWIVDSGTACA
jgi:hypothetical protein